MGQFSMEKPVAPGSALSGNQHAGIRLLDLVGALAKGHEEDQLRGISVPA